MVAWIFILKLLIWPKKSKRENGHIFRENILTNAWHNEIFVKPVTFEIVTPQKLRYLYTRGALVTVYDPNS